MNYPVTLLTALLLALPATGQSADTFIVEDGKPRAEIVISETPTRMQRVAAHEFRMQIEKISGARLPIVTAPSGKAVKIFIGASPQNPVKADGLKDGAYRIATGADWMALVGDDSEFTPMEPFAKNNGDIPRAQAEWEKIVGAPYGMPARGLYKNRLRLPGDTGNPMARPRSRRRRSKSGASTNAAASTRCAATCASSVRAGICRANWAKCCRR